MGLWGATAGIGRAASFPSNAQTNGRTTTALIGHHPMARGPRNKRDATFVAVVLQDAFP